MTDNKDIIERLNQFAKEKKISLRRLELSSGLNEGVIKTAKSQNSALGSDKLVLIITQYPDLNLNWLLTGAGEMIEKGENTKINVNQNHNGVGNNQMSIGECEKEVEHLKELLAEKERLIQVLLNK